MIIILVWQKIHGSVVDGGGGLLSARGGAEKSRSQSKNSNDSRRRSTSLGGPVLVDSTRDSGE